MVEKIKITTKNGAPIRPDKRKALRSGLPVLKVMWGERNVFFGYAKNISKSGMFVSTVNPKEIDDKFTITFTIPNGGSAIQCKCRVVWAREFKPKQLYEPGMGLELLDLKDEMKKDLHDWVNTIKKGTL